MLVIRRRPGEALLVGDNVEVEILEIVGSQVKLGIRAPREIAVLHKELFVTIEQNRAAAQLPQDAAARVLDWFKTSGTQVKA